MACISIEVERDGEWLEVWVRARWARSWGWDDVVAADEQGRVVELRPTELDLALTKLTEDSADDEADWHESFGGDE